jgi:hypothetical protein
VDVEDKRDQRGEGYGDGPREIPSEVPSKEPWPANGLGVRMRGLGDGRQRERDNGATYRTAGEVGERPLALMRRQRVLNKGVELVRVWMEPGLMKFAHD